MNKLTDEFSTKGRTIEVLTNYIQEYVDSHWKQIWDQHQIELKQAHAKGGDLAYGVYISKLFRIIAPELTEASLSPNPILPGSFPQSKEQWGPWEERERRFWSVIYQENDEPLGTVVTRIFHDHTCLRIPKPPQLYSLYETDPVKIAQAIMLDPK